MDLFMLAGYLLNINETDITLILVCIILGLILLGLAWPRLPRP